MMNVLTDDLLFFNRLSVSTLILSIQKVFYF